MKGFYFSLDSLLASSIMLAVIGLLISYPAENADSNKPYQLDKIENSLMQPIEQWNSSYNSSDTVLGYVKSKFFNGSRQEAENICEMYFKVDDEYAVYLTNSSFNQKICGDYSIASEDELDTKQVLSPSVISNNTIIEPKSAVMVIKN